MAHLAKEAIIHAFRELIDECTLDKVRVKMICEKAGVNRQTFYYHYNDIVDLMQSVIGDELYAYISDGRTYQTWTAGYKATLEYLRKNKKMIMHIFNSSYWPEASGYFKRFSNKLLTDVIEECKNSMNIKLEEKDQNFMVTYYRIILNGFMEDYIKNDMEEDPDAMIKKLQKMMSGNIVRSIGAFAQGKTIE